MRKILSLVLKEFQQLSRDRKMVWLVFISPLMQLILLGYAANLDVRDIPTAVCDLDESPQSRAILSEFLESGYFRGVRYLDRIEEIDAAILDGTAALAIVVPSGFGTKVLSGDTAALQLVVDGSNSNSATIGMGYAGMIAGRHSRNIVLERLGRNNPLMLQPTPVNLVPRVWYNPELQSRNFMVPSILGLILMVTTMILTSMAVVKEKEIGTMEQLIVTPIRPLELVVGKLAPFVIISLIDIGLVLLVTTFLFGVRVLGSVPLLFALSGVFLLTTLGLGLLISTISKNQQQAMMTAVFFVMLPMTFLSGFVFPIENMPRLIQYFTYLLPLRYYFVIIRGVFLKGVGFDMLWRQALILFLFGAGILGLSVTRFKKRLE